MHIYREVDFINPKENISIHACRAVADEPMHTHEFVELVYIFTGSATHEIGSAAYDVQRGRPTVYRRWADTFLFYKSMTLLIGIFY